MNGANRMFSRRYDMMAWRTEARSCGDISGRRTPRQVRHPWRTTRPPPARYRPRSTPNVHQTARIWNYWLGGKDNFPVDRQVGDLVLEAFPAIVETARFNRPFLGPFGAVPGR